MTGKLPLRANSAAFVMVAGLAAFSAYFCMYAFRKPVAAAQFEGYDPALGLDYKLAVILFQVLGYALSKWIGVRVIAELSHRRRTLTISGLMSASFLALLGFGAVPAPWNLPMIFLASLPLGMIWGCVFAWLEGRRSTETLVAILSASFILASGAVKSVGAWLIGLGVSEAWMPAATATLFALPMAFSVAILAQMPPPVEADRAERRVREPMGRSQRAEFLQETWRPLALLGTAYIALSLMRDVRDSFAAEIWAENSRGGEAAIFTQSEAPIALLILSVLALFSRIRDSLQALHAAMAAILAGCLVLIGSTLVYRYGHIGGLSWMILSGSGLFLAYVAISSVVIERLVALGHGTANAGFAVYLIDSAGYTASASLFVAKGAFLPGLDWSGVVAGLAYTSGGVGILAGLLTLGLVKRQGSVSPGARIAAVNWRTGAQRHLDRNARRSSS